MGHLEAYTLSDDFARHRCLRHIDQRLSSKRVHLDAQLFLHELDSLSSREAVPSDDRRRVDFRLDELVRPAQELRRDNDHRCRSIADLLVLFLCKIDEDFSSRMLDCEHGQDGRAVVGDRHLL